MIVHSKAYHKLKPRLTKIGANVVFFVAKKTCPLLLEDLILYRLAVMFLKTGVCGNSDSIFVLLRVMLLTSAMLLRFPFFKISWEKMPSKNIISSQGEKMKIWKDLK